MTEVSFIPHTPALAELIATHEEWLMAQVLEYADRQNFGNMEAIGTMVGGIAHNFYNILSAILGVSELAIDRPCPPRLQSPTGKR